MRPGLCARPQRRTLVCDARWPRYTHAPTWRPPFLVLLPYVVRQNRAVTTVVRNSAWLMAFSGNRVAVVSHSQKPLAPTSFKTPSE